MRSLAVAAGVLGTLWAPGGCSREERPNSSSLEESEPDHLPSEGMQAAVSTAKELVDSSVPTELSAHSREEVEKRWNGGVDDLSSIVLELEDPTAVEKATVPLRRVAERFRWCRSEGSLFPAGNASCVTPEILDRWRKAAAHLHANPEVARALRDLFDEYDLLQGADMESSVAAGIHYNGL